MSINKSRLFNASCMALVVTSMTFAIRAGMISDLTKTFNLTESETGWVVAMAAFGFPVATTLGGFFVDALGMRRFMWLAFASHLLGIVLTIFAGGFWTLFLSTFLVGFANGTVEAVCNPLVASMYTDNKTTMLNKFHVWFPGGIVIGSLLSIFMKDTLHWDWQMRVAILLVPTVLYALLFWKQAFPPTERVATGVSMGEMISAVVSPLFIFMALCMFLTANTELSTTQWVEKLLKSSGADPMLVLALATGIMAVGRYFGGPIIHKLNPVGVLLMSAILATISIYMLRTSSGNMVYVAAAMFGVGVCYFWPTMLGFVSENIPKSGALGLSLMGGAGMLGASAFQALFLGPKLGEYKAAATASGLVDENAIDLSAGQHVLANIGVLPMILTIAFAGLYFFMNNKDKK